MTLTELLVAMTVSLVVAATGWTFYRTQLRLFGDQSSDLDASEAARSAMDFVTREIRRAAYDPQGTALVTTGQRGLSVAEASRLLLESDGNGSGAIEPGAVDPSAESVLYAYDAGTGEITRTVAGSTQSLVKHVPADGFQLTYFDQAGNSLALAGTPGALSASDRDRVAYVRLKLRVRSSRSTSQAIVEEGARVAVRNRVLDRL
jgi:Tfp pilus assembly protein PilW